ncbi:MAG: hypothetical protein IJB85_05705 [Clostridia bacterium]|nr:hypothetical protein [Clostridia bacterium]
MGTFADSLFTVLMSWVRALVNGLWALFSADHTTLLGFLGKNWLVIAVVIVAAGLVIDWMIWLLRWQPYHLWAQRMRRLLRMEEPQAQEEAPQRAHAATMPMRIRDTEVIEEEELPLYVEPMQEEEEQAVLAQAQQAPDEYAYPGMRYGSSAPQEMGGTQRFGAVTQEGPGAAEVEKRREEIKAWQLQMQEEARARALAEQARREREAYEAEQARLAQEAYEAEQARLAQEAYEAEQARLAQEEYERQMTEYERQKAQYALELAEYERQKAEYEGYMAREAAQEQQEQEPAPQAAARRRRNAQSKMKTYSDYVAGETVSQLPDAPEWPQMQAHDAPDAAQNRRGGLLDRMAKMIEPEEEQLASRTKLPPRVDVKDAYKPAAAPRKPGKRSRNA